MFFSSIPLFPFLSVCVAVLLRLYVITLRLYFARIQQIPYTYIMKTRTAPDSERIIITISKADRHKLDLLAEKDDRSLSGYCRRVLHEHVQSMLPEETEK